MHPLKRAIQLTYTIPSKIGERLGWNWLTYNHGIFLEFHRGAKRNAPHLADAVLKGFPDAKSLADIGCGTGGFAAEFMRRGLKVVACEYNAKPRRWARKQNVDVHPFDVSKPLTLLPGAPFDIAMSLEVGEHIPAPLADAFVSFLIAHGRAVVLTCAQPGQTGTGHINEQPRQYWIDKFAARGWPLDQARTQTVTAHLKTTPASGYLWKNMMVFLPGPNAHARPA